MNKRQARFGNLRNGVLRGGSGRLKQLVGRHGRTPASRERVGCQIKSTAHRRCRRSVLALKAVGRLCVRLHPMRGGGKRLHASACVSGSYGDIARIARAEGQGAVGAFDA
jgi:hypothetical protein